MRSFEERKAEVFRRSENRIKERRKARNRALAVCIPLCLIITVWSVTVLPAMLPVNNKNSGLAAERAENTSDATYYSKNEYVRIETRNSTAEDQTAILKNDPEEIAETYRLVQSMLNYSEKNDNHRTEDHEQQTAGGNANKAASAYKITFTATDGDQTCYMLNDHVLIDIGTNKETVLTEEQYVQLLQALGVALEKEDGK